LRRSRSHFPDVCRLYGAYRGFFFCIATWDQAVRSYWSGQNFGDFETSSYSCEEYMPMYEARATVSACVQGADILTLNLESL
jgi:hypothetical protein